MSEWSKTPPTKPGWHWVRSRWDNGNGPREGICALSLSSAGVWSCKDSPSSFASVRLPEGAEFGPAIPSAEVIEKAKAALRMFAADECVTSRRQRDFGMTATGCSSRESCRSCEARAAMAALESKA